MNFKWTEHQFHSSHCILLGFIIQINNETLREKYVIFIVVPCCMLFQSLLYCSNSCTSLHFKI